MPDGTIMTMIRRASPLRPTASTFNREARTVEAVAATAASVRQGPPSPMGAFNAWNEVLEHAAQTRAASLMPVVTAARGRVPQEMLDTLHTRAQAEGWDAPALRAALWDAAVQAAPAPSIPATQIGESYDDPAVRMRLRADALAAQILGRAPTGPARQYMAHRGFTGMAQAMLEERGVKVRGMSSSDMIGEALNVRSHTTGDFPHLLTGTGDRVLTGLRDAAPSPLRAVSKPRDVPDFRPFSSIIASGPASLQVLAEGGGVQYTTFYESKETGRLATYARNVGITRQMLVNDDLGALASASRFWASGIAATERTLFLVMFATNGGGFGPTMADGNPLFSTAHGNATTGTASTTGIANARKAMREQVDLNGNLLAVGPTILLSGPTSETALEQAVSSITIATTEANRPIFSGLRIEVEAGLTGAPFFAFADPMVSPVIEYVTLAGRGGAPAFETFSGPDRDGVVIRCTHDVAVFACGWTGAVRVNGA